MKVATEIREYLNSRDSLGMLDCGSPWMGADSDCECKHSTKFKARGRYAMESWNFTLAIDQKNHRKNSTF